MPLVYEAYCVPAMLAVLLSHDDAERFAKAIVQQLKETVTGSRKVGYIQRYAEGGKV